MGCQEPCKYHCSEFSRNMLRLQLDVRGVGCDNNSSLLLLLQLPYCGPCVQVQLTLKDILQGIHK
jgi:hypothetical protein